MNREENGMPHSIRALVLICVAVGIAASPEEAVKPGKWRPGSAPKEWEIQKTRHYQVQAQVDPELASNLVDHVEAMMMEYHRRFYTRKPLKDFVLKVFRGREGYRDYGGGSRALAHYNPRDRELVCFDTGRISGADADLNPYWYDRMIEALEKMGLGDLLEDAEIQTLLRHLASPQLLGVLAHEAWHQYFHFWVVSQVEFPAWLDEGMGDYFYTAQVSPDRQSVRCGILSPMRFPVIYAAIKNGTHVPIKELLTYRQPQYYERPGLCYAQGWSMVYFCYHGGNPKYEKIPDKLIHVFKDKHDMEKATQAAFRGINIDRFEEEWKQFYLSMDFGEALAKICKDMMGFDPRIRSTVTAPSPPAQ